MSSERSKRKSGRRRETRASSPASSWKLDTPKLLLLTFLIALGYCLYSLLSDGLYQHDEAAHFLNMRAFWHDQSMILGNWAKTGYKLLFVPIALLGPTAVMIANCLIAAFCCYFAYRLAEALGSEVPLLAFVLLAFQPFWIQMSFRSYPEPLAALLLLGAALLHYRDKPVFAALLLSYSATIRQELYVIAVLYGLYLLFNRRFTAVLALMLFPLLYHIWGWIVADDHLYLFNQLFRHSRKFQEAYPRHGFDHYFLMSLTIFGAFALTFLLVYIGQGIIYKKRLHAFLLVPAGAYFLEHSLFNLQSLSVGPATGGVLRYLIIISPLVAVMAAIGAGRLSKSIAVSKKLKLLYVLVPFVIAVIVFMRYRHNNLVFTKEIDPLPVITALVAVSVVFLPLSRKTLMALLLIFSIAFTVLTVRPIERSCEDEIMHRVVSWVEENEFLSGPVLVDHTMFFYIFGKMRHEFPNGALEVTEENVKRAAIGTKILWDSHYSYRPEFKDTQVDFTYFMERPEQYRLMTEPRYFSDRRFWLLAFEKIADD